MDIINGRARDITLPPIYNFPSEIIDQGAIYNIPVFMDAMAKVLSIIFLLL